MIAEKASKSMFFDKNTNVHYHRGGTLGFTSIVAFLPLTFIRGHIGDLLGALPTVVACALLMSLIESLLILPSHMGHSLARRSRSLPGRWVGRIRRADEVCQPVIGIRDVMEKVEI